MDFDVEPDGTTSNVRVEDAEPPGVFDVASIRAVKKWKYNPISDGSKKRHVQTILTFELPGSGSGESSAFIDARKRISEAIEAGDLATAKSELKLLRSHEADTSFKIYYQALFEYAIALGEGDYLAAHNALSRTLSAGENMTTNETKRVHLRQIFLLETKQKYFGSAVVHFQELDKMPSSHEASELRPYYENILAILNRPEPILYTMQTESNCVYCIHDSSTTLIQPYRTDFQVQNIVGELKSVTVKCTPQIVHGVSSDFEMHKYEKYKVTDPLHIRVSHEKNESCQITITGTPGSALDVIEFWDNPSAHSAQ
ncbi:MAG: hypothetical protein EP347_11835 [Alphaproteobacteria bacterium]|nr:MAG: hypothetical protein EP347_11835 [Alphaproteobacteria bacterium]